MPSISGPGRGARAALRGGNGTVRPGGRARRRRIFRCLRPGPVRPPGGGNSACAGAGPDIASTVRCNSSSVKDGAINSNTTGRYFILPRSRAIAVARMRRWSNIIAAPSISDSPREPDLPLSRRGFLDQAGFVEQLVALQHFFLVPGHAVGAEAEPHPVAAQFRRLRAGGAFHEAFEPGQDDRRRSSGAWRRASLPRENNDTSRASAYRAPGAGVIFALAGQRQIADRNHARASALPGPGAADAARDRRRYRAVRYSQDRNGSARPPICADPVPRCVGIRGSKGPKGSASSLSVMRHHQGAGIARFSTETIAADRPMLIDMPRPRSQAGQGKSGGDAFRHHQRAGPSPPTPRSCARLGPAPRRHGAPEADWDWHGARAGASPARSRFRGPAPAGRTES